MSWQKVKLGDVCSIEKGKIGIMKAVPGDFPLVVLGEERRSHNEFHFDGKAVIIPLVSSTGHGHRSLKRIHYEEGKFAVGDILCVVMPNNYNELDSIFLYHYLDLNKEKELVGRMKGMANVSLPIKSLAEIEIPLPSLHEQKTIVEKLSTISNQTAPLTAELSHQLDLVKQLRQSFLREAMQGKLVKQDPKDEPASELLQNIKAVLRQAQGDKKVKKQKELPPIKEDEITFAIPENWVWCRLGEICELNPRNKCEDDTEAAFVPMPMISQKFGERPQFETRKWGQVKAGFTHFADNDVVIAKITPCFENSKSGIMKNLPNGIGAGTTELYVVRGNKYVLPEYIYCFFKNPAFLKSGERIMRGVAGQQRVPSEYVYNSLIPLPPLPEQHRIVAKLEQLMQLCDDLEQSIRQSKEQTNMLLQTALREALQPKAEVVKLPALQETR